MNRIIVIILIESKWGVSKSDDWLRGCNKMLHFQTVKLSTVSTCLLVYPTDVIH